MRPGRIGRLRVDPWSGFDAVEGMNVTLAEVRMVVRAEVRVRVRVRVTVFV